MPLSNPGRLDAPYYVGGDTDTPGTGFPQIGAAPGTTTKPLASNLAIHMQLSTPPIRLVRLFMSNVRPPHIPSAFQLWILDREAISEAASGYILPPSGPAGADQPTRTRRTRLGWEDP